MKKFLFLGLFAVSQWSLGQNVDRSFSFKSLEGATMQMNFQTTTWKNNENNAGGTANNFTVLVSEAHLNTNSKVHAYITDTCTWSISRQNFQQYLESDLAPTTAVNDIASAKVDLQGSLPTNYDVHGGDSYSCTPQISFVIDGVWQTDPMNGTHDFKFGFYRAP